MGILVAKNLENLENLKMLSNIVRLQDNILFDKNTWMHKAINKSNLDNGGTWIDLQISKVYSLEDQNDV